MEFIIGFCVGGFLVWAVAMRLKAEWKKDIESLKDYEVWKNWKNK
jgi:hypothetical protein